MVATCSPNGVRRSLVGLPPASRLASGWALRAQLRQRPTKVHSDGGSGTTAGLGLTSHPGYANMGMYQRMKDLTWLADSRARVKSFPAGVQDDIGYALYAAQLGEKSVKASRCMVLADR